MRAVTIILATTLGATTLLGIGAVYQAWKYRAIAIQAENSLARAGNEFARVSVLKDAGITQNADESEIVRSIRDHIYRTNIVGSGQNHGWRGELIYAHLGQAGNEQLCGGLSLAHAWALNMAGIPARTVQLAAKTYLVGARMGDTHVTVEALVEDKWIVTDPTFNVEFSCSDDVSGDRIGIEAMRQCVIGGNELVAHNGATQTPGRRLDEYNLAFEDLLAAYQIAGNPPISYPHTEWLDAQASYAESGL
jgi:hypothetical protein